MARLILTEAGEDVDVGGNVTVVGTTAGGEVITVLRGNIVLDPSFNTGGDTVRLPDLASAFTIRIQGSTAILVGPNVSITIPVGSAGLQVVFDDVARTLQFNTATNSARLGDQVITASETGVLPVGASQVRVGTEGADVLDGTAGDDVIDGLGGNDTINGGDGDDFLRGGAGDDTINGGGGEDQIYGGSGNDRIIDNEGSYAVIDGGLGNDHISITNYAIDSLNLSGGDGDDLIELTFGTTGFAIVNAGSGNDRVVVNSQGMDVSLLLGAGRDELVIPAEGLNNGNFGLIIVRDFEVGSNGDKVDLASALSGYLQNYTPGTNPFASGHLRLIDVFGNAYLQVDRDGPNGSGTFDDLINFAGIGKDALTADNFSGFDPRASVASSAKATALSVPEPEAIAQIAQPVTNVAYAPQSAALFDESAPELIAAGEQWFGDLAYEAAPNSMALHVDHGSYFLF